MINGVIFDLDGTLIDSMKSWENADRRFLIENRIDPSVDPLISEKMKRLSMREAAEYFIKLGVDMQPDEITERIEQLVYDEYENTIELKPYVKDFLELLDDKKINYCVATANYRTLTDTVLKRHGIYDRFKFIYTCAETGIKKDSPLFFKNVAEKLGSKVKHTAVIDDSVHCIESAKNAGFYTIAVLDDTANDDHSRLKEISDMTIKTFSELIEKADLIF